MDYSDTYTGSAMSKQILKSMFSAFIFVGLSNCAPVKFSRSDAVVVPNAIQSVACMPKINDSLVSFTYGTTVNPNVVSKCNPSNNLTYTWTVKNSSGAVINTPVAGLTGANPMGVDFAPLGVGAYYVFLQATDNNGRLASFNAATPLEFIVPGVGLGTLNCDPKLNSTFLSVVVGTADANPTVTANCNPSANTHMWTVYKGSIQVVVPNLGGANSTNPDFKSLGVGDYRVYLYATATNTTSYSSTALNVKVTSDFNPSPDKILCNPRINGTLRNLTITPSSSNPLITSSCTPTAVQYNWTVTKNGQTISVPSLVGSNSNPDFLSQGQGTYLIYLTASKPGSQPWTDTSPLVLTVDSGGVIGTLNVNCAPRLNGTFVSVTIPTSGTNPTVTSGCDPSNASLTWNAVKDGVITTLPGLAGPSSVPQFIQSGSGTYLLYLSASAPGYNSYVSPFPLEVSISNGDPIIKHVTFTKNVNISDNKVDILLVVDDSNSMLPDNQKLAQKLQGFVGDLTSSGLDWQMCATVTRAQTINGTAYWGASKNWVGYLGSPAWIMKLGATNPYAIFTDTINSIGAGWAGTDDERAIKAAYSSFDYAAYNNCYRADASLAVIVLSDEDERSIGGNMAIQYYYQEWKVLEPEDYPQALVNKVKQQFGAQKPFSVNSIIVKPGDTACMAEQDAGGSKSHYGYKYAELSQLTQGYTGSICDADFSQSLYYFKDKIKQSLSSIPLDCAPIGPVDVLITPAMGGVTSQVVNNTLVFTPAIPAGRTVTIDYDCPMH